MAIAFGIFAIVCGSFSILCLNNDSKKDVPAAIASGAICLMFIVGCIAISVVH